MSSVSPVVELAVSAARLPPAEALEELAAQCRLLGVQSMDLYGDVARDPADSWLRRFELEVTACLGVEEAVFMPSGVMAQSIVLAVHGGEQPAQRSFICHHSSHILLHEEKGYSDLVRMTPVVIPREEGALVQPPITYAAMAPLLAASPSPACAIVECPHREIGGKLTPWEDLVQISAECRRRGVPLHMDGARLWEAAGGYGRPLAEVCALFDSVYVSLYKGLGGLAGAMLLGTKDFIAQARIWQRRFGGVLHTQLPLAVSCWAGFRAHRDSFGARLERLQQVARVVTEVAAEDAAACGGSVLVRFDPPVPEVSMVHYYLRCSPGAAAAAKATAAQECGVACFTRLRGAGDDECYTEFNMGPLNSAVSDDVWREGWRCFLRHLRVQLTA
ncbi:unnamed protein product [Ectocarpus fasciculatus]